MKTTKVKVQLYLRIECYVEIKKYRNNKKMGNFALEKRTLYLYIFYNILKTQSLHS